MYYYNIHFIPYILFSIGCSEANTTVNNDFSLEEDENKSIHLESESSDLDESDITISETQEPAAPQLNYGDQFDSGHYYVPEITIANLAETQNMIEMYKSYGYVDSYGATKIYLSDGTRNISILCEESHIGTFEYIDEKLHYTSYNLAQSVTEKHIDEFDENQNVIKSSLTSYDNNGAYIGEGYCLLSYTYENGEYIPTTTEQYNKHYEHETFIVLDGDHYNYEIKDNGVVTGSGEYITVNNTNYIVKRNSPDEKFTITYNSSMVITKILWEKPSAGQIGEYYFDENDTSNSGFLYMYWTENGTTTMYTIDTIPFGVYRTDRRIYMPAL